MKEGVRIIISAIYAAAFANVSGHFAIYYAYVERGYKAVGGEYFIFGWTFWVVYKAMKFIFMVLDGE